MGLSARFPRPHWTQIALCVILISALIYVATRVSQPHALLVKSSSLKGEDTAMIVDANTWRQNVILNLTVFNPNPFSVTYPSLIGELGHPFLQMPLGVWNVPLHIGAGEEWSLVIPLSVSSTNEMHGLDIPLGCGYFGILFAKSFVYTLDLGPNVKTDSSYIQTNCPFTFTTLPANLLSRMPGQTQTMLKMIKSLAGDLNAAQLVGRFT